MQLMGLFLVLINVSVVFAPITCAAIVYRDNLSGLVVPPQVNELISQVTLNSSQIALPQVVDYAYDTAAKTITVIFNFTNPLNLNITLNALSADVVCDIHNVILGHVEIAYPVALEPDVTVYLLAVFFWTETAENHFISEHAGQSAIDILLTNISIDVSDLAIEAPITYHIGYIPIAPV
jgi:hypothetical protein